MRPKPLEVKIVDTFPSFESYWSLYQGAPTSKRLEGWTNAYMTDWPDLHRVQTKQYRAEGADWRRVIKTRILPFLGERLPKMRLARKRLLSESQQIIRKASKQVGFPSRIYVVIYVGLGLGAGWATIYKNRPALLFGLENIAEEGWTGISEIRGLITHELGHLVHSFWREKAGKRFLSNPLWQLYTEGFADRFEVSLQGNGNSHRGYQDQESSWFNKNRQWLATEFLKRVQKKEDCRDFFGSWFSLRGHSQMGYFLGSEIVEELEKTHTFQEIATLGNVSHAIKNHLIRLGGGGT